jgi:TRAP-type C4-dicarboxylate transport system substrate-binding protein
MKSQKCSVSLFVAFAALAAFLLVFAPGIPVESASAATIELKFAHQNPPKGRTTVKFLDPWMKKVEAATKGQVKIVSYPAQSLAKANQNFEAVEGGIAEMSWIQLGYYPGRFPLTDVMTLPFIPIPGAAKNSRILQELYETFPEMQKHYSTVKVLFLHTSDPYFLATRKPVRNIEDIKGMKLRIMGSEPSEASKRLGASPLFMPMPGVYEAAEKGVIDGAALPWAALATFRLNEVFRYWTDASTWVAPFLVGMNLDTWNSLPPDVQDQIMSVSGVAGAEFAANSGWGPDILESIEAKTKGTKAEMDRVVLDEGEYAKWKKMAGEPIWEEWVKRMEAKNLPGRKVLDEALRLLHKYE